MCAKGTEISEKPPEAPASCPPCGGSGRGGFQAVMGAGWCHDPPCLCHSCQGLRRILCFPQIGSAVPRCPLDRCVSVGNQPRTGGVSPRVPSHGSGRSRALLEVFHRSFFPGTLLWLAAKCGKSSKAEQEKEDQTVLVSDRAQFSPFVVFPSLSFAQLNSNLLTTDVEYHCKLNLILCEVKVNMTEKNTCCT